MVKSRVDHGVRLRCSTGEAVGIFQRPAMGCRSRLLQPTFTGVGTGQPPHLMTCAEKFLQNTRTDEADCTGKENTYETPPTCLATKLKLALKLNPLK